MLSVAEALARAPLFQGLPQKTLDDLASAVQHRHFNDGDTVFEAGDEGVCVYVVAAGEVRIQLERPTDGQVMVLALRGPGEAFGELALVDGGKRSATAVAIDDDTDLLYVGRKDFMRLLREQPEAVDGVLKVLGTMLRESNERMKTRVLKDVHAQMAQALLELAKHHGVETDQGTLIDHDVTAGELAAYTDLHKATVEQLMASYQFEDIIRVDKRRVTIVRRDVLDSWL